MLELGFEPTSTFMDQNTHICLWFLFPLSLNLESAVLDFSVILTINIYIFTIYSMIYCVNIDLVASIFYNRTYKLSEYDGHGLILRSELGS